MRAWCLIIAAALLLAGCGKKADLAPPEGQADLYKYPSFYPPAGALGPEGAAPDDGEDDPAGLGLTGNRPSNSPLPPGRTSSETYGAPD